MATEPTSAPNQAWVARQAWARLGAAWVVLPLFFLISGGTLRWWQAWAWCAAVLVPMTVFVGWVVRHDPEFIARRIKLREKERTQRRILAWSYPFFMAAMVLPGLDRRFGWSHPPLGAVIVALILVLGGYLAVVRVFQENRWAGRTVETNAGQQVIASGPYAVVRHPMYAAVLVLYLATPVALGSWWAVLPMLSMIPTLVLRIRNEEQVLVRELPGYEEYRRRVRFRLVPGIW